MGRLCLVESAVLVESGVFKAQVNTNNTNSLYIEAATEQCSDDNIIRICA